jgi:hypothetical protein
LAGETDRNFYARVNAALTGETSSGPFSMGMHLIKQIRFEESESVKSQEKSKSKK